MKVEKLGNDVKKSTQKRIFSLTLTAKKFPLYVLLSGSRFNTRAAFFLSLRKAHSDGREGLG